MEYDGKDKLGAALADLYQFSSGNNTKIASLIKDAKDNLGITSKSKNFPDDVKLAIYRWHYERLNSVQDIKQNDSVQDDDVQSLDDTVVQDVKHSDDDKLAILPDNIVQDIKQDAPVQFDGVIDSSVYDFKQIHFAITITYKEQPKRTTVMLEGYLVKALQRKYDFAGNAAIRAWIEQAIKEAGDKFDSSAPLTKQVKRLIIESFV